MEVAGAIGGGLHPNEIGQDEVECVPSGKTGFDQTHLGGVFQKLLDQINGQLFMSFAQDQDDKPNLKDQPKAKPKTPTAVKANETLNRVLAPIRDDHQLPGLIGAVVTGNTLSAIGAVGLVTTGFASCAKAGAAITSDRAAIESIFFMAFPSGNFVAPRCGA